ncbi:MAG: hypothetical protein HUJ74_03260 [Lachnospiraceae bacterium]|nr:hypothetical protein [Lachnospiraceae bacterium]
MFRCILIYLEGIQYFLEAWILRICNVFCGLIVDWLYYSEIRLPEITLDMRGELR